MDLTGDRSTISEPFVSDTDVQTLNSSYQLLNKNTFSSDSQFTEGVWCCLSLLASGPLSLFFSSWVAMQEAVGELV